MGLNPMGLAADTARLRRIAAILQDGMGEGTAPLPALIDLLNRALRPLSVLAVLALPAGAFLDPARYAAGVAALRQTPWQVWGLCAAILALHFLAPVARKAART